MKNSVEALMPVGLIGPTFPFRGGIAQHTTMLHRSLSALSDLCTVSFKRQYPQVLYPGKSNLDPEYKGYSEPGVRYVIDSLNPLTWMKACRILMASSPKLVIIIWCTFFGAPYLGFMANYFRKRDTKVLYLCHNVIDHESALWKVALSRKALSQSSTFLVHSRSEKKKVNMLVPRARVAVHPHPVYNQFPSAKNRLPRRARLELLFFGFVRHYKGLDVLLNAMLLLDKEDVFLTVAGEWWERDITSRQLLEDERLRSSVEVIDSYLSEKKVAELFIRTDIVVLPYRSATGTGVIPLAYHYGKPVIGARTGGIPEVVNDGISGRLFEPENQYDLAEVIREFLAVPPESMKEGVQEMAKEMTWNSLARCILDL